GAKQNHSGEKDRRSLGREGQRNIEERRTECLWVDNRWMLGREGQTDRQTLGGEGQKVTGEMTDGHWEEKDRQTDTGERRR
ncbi:hypothetical protein ACQP3L_38930, partial [Escherichia coli]